jgi:asparagine synthase (glutamine-hydrolysing)
VALHLPARAKVRGRTGKWVLKRVAAERLPRRLVYAKKRGYPLPNDHHRGAAGLLRGGAVPDLLGWTRQAEGVLVPRIEADPVLRQQMAGMEIWARLFVRGESPGHVTARLLAAAEGRT